FPERGDVSMTDRRQFLTSIVAVGAAAAAAPARSADEPAAAAKPSALPPNEYVAAAETQTPSEMPPNRIGGKPGSDFMVDVIKTLNIKYCPANCASSYRGIHESLINYGGNKMPEFLTCMHEESAAAMAHGYLKVAGKPLMTLCHGTVGLQQEPIRTHGSEKLYIPRYVPSSPPAGDSGAVKEAARLLAAADNPVIVADRMARTQDGLKLLVQLAETLNARVVDIGSRTNF